MKHFGAAVAASFLFSAGVAQAATNIVVNGSFESGLSGWTSGGAIGDSKGPAAAIFYNSATPYPTGAFGEAVLPDNLATSLSPDAVGKRAVYFVSDKSKPETLSQTLMLNPGSYVFGFSVYAPANGLKNAGDARFQASLGSASAANFLVSSLTAKTWKLYQQNVVITAAGSYALTFEFNTNQHPSKDIVVDRVYVMAVPEPQTWMMMILGFGMVAGALRRRHAAAVAAQA